MERTNTLYSSISKQFLFPTFTLFLVMAKNRKRKRRVPEILWRLFRHRACTLFDTIASLIPSPLPDCGCDGRRCLHCIGGDFRSYLLRPDDPSDYRKLLTECFVVVSSNAPSLSTFYFGSRWSQLQVRQGLNLQHFCLTTKFLKLFCL